VNQREPQRSFDFQPNRSLLNRAAMTRRKKESKVVPMADTAAYDEDLTIHRLFCSGPSRRGYGHAQLTHRRDVGRLVVPAGAMP
jgi:hypothetical protein